MMILTGILIEKYGLQTDNVELEKYFGFVIISLGSINIPFHPSSFSKNNVLEYSIPAIAPNSIYVPFFLLEKKCSYKNLSSPACE